MAKFCKECGAELTEGKKFCGSCGAAVETQDTNSGQPQPQTQQAQQSQQNAQNNQNNPNNQYNPNAQNKGQSGSYGGLGNIDMKNITKTADYTGEMDPADIEKNKVISGLAYFLFFLPLIACPESKYGRFHANQALLLLIIAIGGSIISTIISGIFGVIGWAIWQLIVVLGFISFIIWLVVWLVVAVVGIIGLINGFTGKAKELPIVGKFRIIK